jgi:tetratricopeptide (TPR) repeat protein
VAGKGLIGALGLLALMGCSLARTEFYRGETRHLYSRGCEAYGAGELSQARELLTRLVEVDPAHARGHAVLGHLSMAGGDGAAAGVFYRQALTLDPALTEALIPWLVQAEALQGAQRLELAGVDLQGLLELLEAGNDERLQEMLEACPALDDLARDAFSLTPRERWQLRRHVLRRLLTTPAAPSERLFAGLFLGAEGTADPLAVRALETWLGDNPSDARRPLALNQLLALYLRLGDTAAFLEAWQQAEAEGVPAADLARAAGSAATGAPGDQPSPVPDAPRRPHPESETGWFRLVTMGQGG